MPNLLMAMDINREAAVAAVVDIAEAQVVRVQAVAMEVAKEVAVKAMVDREMISTNKTATGRLVCYGWRSER
jgi:hypothetical protein